MYLRRLFALSLIGLLALALTPVAAAQPAPVQAGGTLELIFPDPPDVPHWITTLSGDIEGVARIDVTRAEFHGSVERWEEVMVINTTDGATIVAVSRGVWDMDGLEFSTLGTVVIATGADGAYDHLAGLAINGQGSLDSNVLGPGLTGTLTFRIR